MKPAIALLVLACACQPHQPEFDKRPCGPWGLQCAPELGGGCCPENHHCVAPDDQFPEGICVYDGEPPSPFGKKKARRK